ncbi:MAG: DEAD/DEAH box helicase [Gemmataceae bacterium]
MLDCPPVESAFAGLGLDPRLVESLAAHNYSEPTPIQRAAIPPLLAGRDLVGVAATGTGKTAAFALPLVQRVAEMEDRRGPAALVLVPTRELAIQVAGAVSRYGKPLGVRVVPVYGGAGFSDQARALKRGAAVVVATPGRALDHVRRGTLNLTDVGMVVLDEADEMLDMGFADDLDAILSATPPDRQTMLFSATMPPKIAAVAARHLTDPVRTAVTAAPRPSGAEPLVRQHAFLVRRDQKAAALMRVLEFEAPASAIVFCRTRTDADALADALAARGHKPAALHGGLTQDQRDRVMAKFRDGTTAILVATDVAARELDIGRLSHVFNFGVPETAEAYVHRVGRVGRAGRGGVAITIAEPREQFLLRAAERASGKRIAMERVPTAVDLRVRQMERTRDALRETILANGLDDAAALVAPLIAEHGAEAVAAAAVALLAQSRPAADEDERDIPPASVPPRQQQRMPTRNRRPDMARLFVDAGRLSGVGRRELLDAIGNHVGLGPREVGDIEVTERFSLVDVPDELAEQVIDSLDGCRIRGRQVAVRRDRSGG